MGEHRTIGAKTLVAALGDDRAGAGFRSLAAGIAAAIERGDLPVGARLPSERALSTAAGCSRGTVVAAYEVLRGQGLVLRRTGSGTWVRRAADNMAPGRAAGSEEHAAAVRARRLTARVLGPGDDDLVDLGLSALAEPWELDDPMLRVTAADLAAVSPRHGYVPSGIDELRTAVAARYAAQGLATDAEQVTITHGAQNALALSAELLVHPGDVVVVEQPTFPGAIDVLARAGARLVTVPVDAGGTDVEALARVLERRDVRAVYLVPTCHSATGATTTVARRREIAGLVDAAGCWLIEDETLAPLHLDGPVPPSVTSFVRSVRSVTIASLAKEVWAGVRVGWIRTDPTTTEHLARLRAAVDLGTSVAGQLVALRCLDGIDQRTERLRAVLSRARRDALRARRRAAARLDVGPAVGRVVAVVPAARRRRGRPGPTGTRVGCLGPARQFGRGRRSLRRLRPALVRRVGGSSAHGRRPVGRRVARRWSRRSLVNRAAVPADGPDLRP